MGEVIDFAEYKRNRDKGTPVINQEGVLGNCFMCSAPAYFVPDDEDPEDVQFAIDQLAPYLSKLNDEARKDIQRLIEDGEKLDEQLDKLIPLWKARTKELDENHLRIKLFKLEELVTEFLSQGLYGSAEDRAKLLERAENTLNDFK